ncbi:hypothetical protein [Nocardia gipuzkoensis]|uniref:hypothetical protein n=1 Tax=Nocardia gipuzkoensis TaxID=2749991 RepID=UPI0015EF6D0B|nr:hypothetical protein [Nocardia gipuzkoensis]
MVTRESPITLYSFPYADGPSIALFRGVDPVTRLTAGLRLAASRAQQNSTLGRLLVRIGVAEGLLLALLRGPTMREIEGGIAQGRYDVYKSMPLDIASLIIGAAIGVIWSVLAGHHVGRPSSSIASDLLDRSVSVNPAARPIAAVQLRGLPKFDGCHGTD